MIFIDFSWISMIFNDFQWFLCVFNTFSLILRLLDTFPARSPQTKITSVPCRIFGPWEVLAKIKKDSTVSIRIRGDFWQHGQAQNSPMPGPNKPKQREWVQQKPKLWSYLTPRTLPPTYALVPNSQNFDTYELQTRSWFDVWKNHATYINGPGHMSLAEPIFFFLQNRDPDRTNFEFWKNDARYINGPCNMSLTKANISKIKPLPGPTGTNFEKHKRNCIATLFGLVFSFEFVWELCNQLVWSPMTRIIRLGGFA